MPCIKTGAYVHFLEYGAYAPADIYLVGEAYIIKFAPKPNSNSDDVLYREQMRPVTHNLWIGRGFSALARGIVAVPAKGSLSAGQLEVIL